MDGVCAPSACRTCMTANGWSPARSTSAPRRSPAFELSMGWRNVPRWCGSARTGPSFVRGVMSLPSREHDPDDDWPSAQDIALGILLESESLPQLMELHYYAGEPGFAEIMRMLIGLPDAERELLR